MGIFSALRDAIPRHDPDGNAPIAAIRAEAVADRDVDELIGIVKGVMADGNVVADEARFLLAWMEQHSAARAAWPGRVMYPRLLAAMSDGHLTGDEESELLGLLANAVGGNAPARGEASMATALPLTDPEPLVTFEGRRFCFTGTFYSGTRDWCEREIESRGGASASVSRKLDYLVIGEIGSRDWIHSTHGRKIEKAVEFRDAGAPISIVCEKHWHIHLTHA